MGTAITIAVVVLALTGAFLSLAFALRSETKRAGEQKARADVLGVNLADMTSKYADATKQIHEQQEQLDDMEDALDSWAADEPVDGAFERMLQRRKAARAARAGGAAVVHSNGAPERDDPDGLLEPGT